MARARLVMAVLFVGSVSTAANAQSQFPVLGQASGNASQGSLEAFQRDQVGAVVFGNLGNVNSLGAVAGGTGRFRETSHNGMRVSPQLFPPADLTYGADIKERTYFASGSMSLPGTVFGGRLRAGLMIGETELDVEAKPNSQVTLPVKGEIGSAKVRNTIFGGNLLWHGSIGYIAAAALYTTGETDMVDKFICCIGQVYQEKHDGRAGSLTIGRVFPLFSEVKVDLRGGLAHTSSKGKPFDTLVPAPFPKVFDQFTYSAASASFSPMLFADLKVGDALLRPYIQGTFKKQFNYSNSSQFSGTGVVAAPFIYDEDHRFTTVEVGLQATFGSWNFGASYFGESSGDSDTRGGKIGLTYQFN